MSSLERFTLPGGKPIDVARGLLAVEFRQNATVGIYKDGREKPERRWRWKDAVSLVTSGHWERVTAAGELPEPVEPVLARGPDMPLTTTAGDVW